MDICFLFTKHLDDSGCFILKLNAEGELVSPPLYHNFDDIRALQKECRTIIVESCENATILDLNLPWLPERKARVAIPYALEEKLAESIDELHFAFDKQHYQNGNYQIAVINKQKIKSLMDSLDEHHIDYESITLDWYALSPNEFCISESTLLISNHDFKGALSGDLAVTYLKKHPLDQVFVFKDSQITAENALPQVEDHSFIWLAQRLLNAKILNLCQSDLQHGQKDDWILKGYKLAATLCGVWLFSLLLVNALQLYSLNKKNNAVEQQIGVVYREFFPDAKQVISPKFRINQLLKQNISDKQAHFWFILTQFAKATTNTSLTVEQMRYQNSVVSVTVVSSDFPSLEAFQKKLKDSQLKVKQTQASTRDQQVVATLELS